MVKKILITLMLVSPTAAMASVPCFIAKPMLSASIHHYGKAKVLKEAHARGYSAQTIKEAFACLK